MKILAFESSCDETACAIVENGRVVFSNVIASQILTHQKTQGVVPEVAARKHVPALNPVFEQALQQANLTMDDIDAIACSVEPGLVNCLITGASMASTLALIYNKPLIPVNHKLGHVLSCMLNCEEDFAYPIVVLSVSGGHNELYLMQSPTEIEMLGSTLDDAAGEAYDKVAKMLGMKYPGGPEISRAAVNGDPRKYKLPYPLPTQKLNFSFSGLKTNIKYLIRDLSENLKLEDFRDDVAASFQWTINNNLSRKLVECAVGLNAKEIHLVGGVSANLDLREQIQNRKPGNMVFRRPLEFNFCTDNAAMIAGAAYFVSKQSYKNPGEALEI